MLDNTDESIKVIVVGDGNVGKTCMLRRFVKGDFIAQYRKTIGAEFMEKDVYIRSSDTTVKLMLWDTAGQEVFNALTQAYYRGAGAAVLTFSTVDRDSFMNIAGWKQRVESVCGPITMVLCQTKFDLSHEAVITNEEAEQLASQLEVPLFRVSTKDDFNVTQLFEFTAQQCMEGAAAAAAAANGERKTEDGGSRVEGERRQSSGGVEGEPTAGTERLGKSSAAPGAGGAPSPPLAGASTDAGAEAPSASPVADPFIPAAAGRAGKGATAPTAAGVKSQSSGGKSKSSPPPKNKVTLKEPEAREHHHKKKFRCSLY
ncbi:putative small G-protein [Leptomonas pyrrhocoris]|uniref:Putative small G-protein n=1 Tax=Leptomonas pyrrhocoris TaxID=157538 RepID=A0A0N0DWH2_LEPPY|nr:putative small G-protein [Leptomonas pyrrhocoris]KPA81791.1 putative small G-protein [Leptomonas pyrrhocoris]|eukprot:XP_015660230.1 putative small G-protein [Leptomonas pyrrhocoris]